MKIICKLQRPIATNDSTMPWLLYNKSRTIIKQIPEVEITLFMHDRMGDDLKAYWECDYKKGQLSFIKRVKEQGW